MQLELGLEMAKAATKALFHNDIISLGVLDDKTLADVFKDKIIYAFLEKGDTRFLDLIIKTGCFNDKSKFKLAFSFFFL